MNPTETRPLPNAADKEALKAIAKSVIQTCPGLQDTAHEVASNLLRKSGITGLDPDKVSLDSTLAALDISSLDLISVLFALEEQFNIAIVPEDIVMTWTVAEFADYVAGLPNR